MKINGFIVWKSTNEIYFVTSDQIQIYFCFTKKKLNDLFFGQILINFNFDHWKINEWKSSLNFFYLISRKSTANLRFSTVWWKIYLQKKNCSTFLVISLTIDWQWLVFQKKLVRKENDQEKKTHFPIFRRNIIFP